MIRVRFLLRGRNFAFVRWRNLVYRLLQYSPRNTSVFKFQTVKISLPTGPPPPLAEAISELRN